MSGFRGIAGATVALLLGALLVAAAPPAAAVAQDDVFVEVNPSTIQAGNQVSVHADCGDEINQASVTSDAFGEITLRPRENSPLLRGSATISTSTRPGEYQVNLRCANGNTASAILFVINMAQPTRGPKAGGGGSAGDDTRATGEAGTGGSVGPIVLAGAGVIALAAGLVLVRRRRAG